MKKFLVTRTGIEILHVNGVPRTSMPQEEIKDFNERLLQVVRHALSTGTISPESLIDTLWADEAHIVQPGFVRKTWYL
jgi:hypothetical protein